MKPIVIYSYLVGGALSSPCEVAYDVVQIQDTTGSFKQHVNEMKKTMKSMIDEFFKSWPGSRYGVVSFADKTLPWVGWGFGETPYNMIKDHCFRVHHPLSTDTEALQQSIQSIRISGGNDLSENAFDALLQAVTRPSIDWREETDANGKHVARVALIVTDAPGHLEGEAAEVIKYWNDSWGLDKRFDPYYDWYPTNYPFQFFYHTACKDQKGQSDYLHLYHKLGENIREGGLAPEDLADANGVIASCGPYWIPPAKPHHGGATADVDCTALEYPSLQQVFTAVQERAVYPVVAVPPSDTGGLAWLQWLNRCSYNATTEQECVMEFYNRELNKIPGLKFKVVAMDGTLTTVLHDLFADVEDTLCEEYGTEWPSPIPTEPIPDEESDCIINIEEECRTCEEFGGEWRVVDGAHGCVVGDEVVATTVSNCYASLGLCCEVAVHTLNLYGGPLTEDAAVHCEIHNNPTTQQPQTTAGIASTSSEAPPISTHAIPSTSTESSTSTKTSGMTTADSTKPCKCPCKNCNCYCKDDVVLAFHDLPTHVEVVMGQSSKHQ
ncbi:MAG: uncharacterized protein KVP18_003725 [Porospora cf. gigantea A]|uniref:uncharacterized protein n=1 Tax=Porospora cf. gigantea A TaxID=2853593 RepID=UPI00355955A7|nr:MAG: hypothetical protein KVP18_003725 [Porospora cf. gigantea A]